jgi:PKD repeat protein
MKKNFLALIFTILGAISLQAQTCDTVRVFPWNNDFYTNFGCWEQLGDSSSLWQLNANNNYNLENAAYINAPRNTAANGCVLVSPALALPADTANMRLSFKTRLSGASVQLRVLVTTGSRDDLSGYDTLLSVTPSSAKSYEVNLSDYAGQTVHVAFSLVKPNQSNTLTFFGVGSVNIISDRMPQGEWLVQNMAMRMGDTVEHEFYLTQGIEEDSNTVFTWHSTLVEAGQATLVEVVTDMSLDYATGLMLPRSIYRVVYHTAGTDTVTVTVSNIYGTVTSQSVSNIYDCAPISEFPWTMELGDLGVCWSTDYSIRNNATHGYNDEDGEMYYTDCYLQSPSTMQNYENFVVTNTIAVPADAAHLALTLRWCRGTAEVRAARVNQETDLIDYVSDTTLFTDLLFNESGSNVLKTRKVSLEAYAGDTIRLAVFNNGDLMLLSIDYDTLPKIASVQVPSLATVDLAALCTASLRYGATEGLHYSWSSARGGVFVTNALGDSAWLTYPGGVGDKDTIRVVAENIYGTDTVVRTVRILDCAPQLVLPWKETFAYGTDCWYKYDGCKFYDAIPYNDPTYESLRSLYLNTMLDTLGSWIMSKAIVIPADASMDATLFWKVASSNTTYHHLYSMLATTSDDYTDTANYTVLYTDNSTHVNFSNYDTRSVSLAQYAGQTIHIAIHNHGNHLASSGIGLYFDDIEVRTTELPVVRLSVPTIVNSHDVVNYTATCAEGSMNGLTLTWRSSLMDTTWVMNGSDGVNRQYVLEMMYTLDGIDTITVIATNNYGTSTATAVVFVNDCTPIATLPYEEPFINVVATAYNASSGGNIPNCWRRYWAGSTTYMPHVIGSYLTYTAIHTYVHSNPALALMAGTGDGFDSVAIVESPLFEIPLNEQMLSFFYMYESASYGQLSVGYIQNGTFVDLADLTPQTAGKTDTVSLSGIPADVHRFAFCWKKSGTWYGAIVDNIRMFTSDGIPSVRLTAPATAFVDDSTTFSASLTNGQVDGLTYTWQSTLLDDTVMGGRQWSVVYTTEGIDTVTVIATNSYGSDTAWAVVTVVSHPLPQVTLSAPTTVYIPDIASFNITLNDCSQNGLAVTCHSSLLDTTIDLNSTHFTLNYTLIGVDTVTVIASNAYGTATAVAVVHIIDCRGAAVPYFEDFEGVTATDWNSAYRYLPECWGDIAIGASHRPKVVSSYPYIDNLPDQALLIMAGIYSGYADAEYALLPLFSDSLQYLSVAFDHRCESASYGGLTVGYWNDSLLTFHPVRNLASPTDNYLRDTVSFADVTGADNHTHIALKWYCNTSYFGVVIDNIEVFRDSSDFAPTGLAVDNVSAHCVTLSWQPYTAATAYHVTIGSTVDTMVSDTVVTICGLDEATAYVAGVAPVVAGVIGHHADVSFSTLPYCSSLSGISYEEDGGNLVLTCLFDSTGETTPAEVSIAVTDLTTGSQWQSIGTGDGDTLTGLAAAHNYRIVVTALCNGTAMDNGDTLEFSMPASVCYEVRGTHSDSYHFIDGYSYYNYDQMLYPAVAVGSVDTLYGIALRVTEQNINRYRMVDIYVGNSTATTLTSPVSATNLTQVADDYTFSIADTGWSRILFDTPFAYDGTSNLIVTMVDNSNFQAPFSPGIGMHAPQAGEAFLYYSKNYSSDPVPDPYTINFTAYTYSWIPDIQLLGGCDYNQCLGPWVTVDSTTTHSISLSWNQRGTESLWQVEYRTDRDAPWTVADTTAATTYTMTGLTPSTTYQFRMASLCSGDIVYGDSITTSTACDTVQLPYHTDFTIEHYPCWNVEGYTWESFLGIILNPNMTQYNHYVVSPAVGTPLNDVTVTVRAMNPNNDSYYSTYDAFYEVGVCDADGSNPVWIDTVGFAQRHVVEEHTFYLHNYTGSARHIIIRPLINSFTLYSVTLDHIRGCIPVHEVWVSHLTDTSATVQWEPENSANSHAVYFEGSLLSIAPAGTTAWPLPTLTPSTEYTVAVREICSAGDTSAAISHTFSTACEAVGLPYFEGFGNGSDLGYDQIHGMPDCWTLHDNPYGTSVYYNPELLLYSSGYADSSISNYIISPLLNVGFHGATVSFKAKAGFASIAGFVEVGVMTNVSDTGSFIPCVTVEFINGGAPLQWYQFNTATMALPDVWAVAIRWDRGHQGAFDSLTVTANPVVEYTLSLDVNDTAMGSVTGGGTYESGSTITITATPNEGYRFVIWSDSVTTPSREILLTSDTTLWATFSPVIDTTPEIHDTIWRNVSVYMVSHISGDTLTENDGVSVTGTGVYADSTLVKLTAIHGFDPYFWYWVTSVGDTIRDNPYSFIITSDTVFTAIFGPMCIEIDNVDDELPTVAIHPNPTAGDAYISVGQSSTVTVIDLHGRTIMAPMQVDNTVRIQQGTLPKGIYFVSVSNERGTAVRKLVIE